MASRQAATRIGGWLLASALLALAAGCRQEQPLPQSQQAARLDKQLDWSKARLIAVQDANRYKTLDSFARESMTAMLGDEHLPGLSPLASLMEWLFNRDAYVDVPLVRVRDKGLRIHFSAHMKPTQRERIVRSGKLTPNELRDPMVQQRINELEPRNTMARAINRVRYAESVCWFLDRMLRIVPAWDPEGTAPWYTPQRLLANASDNFLEQAQVQRAVIVQKVGPPVPGVGPDEAAAVFAPWVTLESAWRKGDVKTVQAKLDQLAEALPKFAAPGTYPSASQRAAESRYYAMGKFTWGLVFYFVGMLVAIPALVTRWRWPWRVAAFLLVVGLVIHGYGLALRWYIVGRIPVANMFEAVIFSAWIGIALALAVELWSRRAIFLVAAHATGFLALVLGGFVIPGGGTITSIMGILDDVMLRIHTVLIIAAYALIFLAAVIATVYLVGYYRARAGATVPAVAGVTGDGAGAAVLGKRPLLAGAMPGDEGRPGDLPAWLHYVDWCHLIILNMAFVMLFVGIILGAVWADYSWGRPWGWDPKEVFAMNTWLVYAILIHVRFVVKRRGLWTAWLSVAGCLMMAFNWCFVNFFIVGLHSYA